jgi:hypothetical protein
MPSESTVGRTDFDLTANFDIPLSKPHIQGGVANERPVSGTFDDNKQIPSSLHGNSLLGRSQEGLYGVSLMKNFLWQEVLFAV